MEVQAATRAAPAEFESIAVQVINDDAAAVIEAEATKEDETTEPA